MLTAVELRNQVKKYMSPVFTEAGFKYKYEGKGMIWQKAINEGEYLIGVGLFIDERDKNKLEFRFTQFVDPEDIRDVRAYRHSGWPPRSVLKKLGIKVPIIDRIFSGGYDAWIRFPQKEHLSKQVLEKYAMYIITDLNSRINKGIRWTKKTHRWEYY